MVEKIIPFVMFGLFLLPFIFAWVCGLVNVLVKQRHPYKTRPDSVVWFFSVIDMACFCLFLLALSYFIQI